jgi:predicted hotdog family 3-hydroxylacyl-ACP dehydratase
MITAIDLKNYLPHRPPILMVDVALNMDDKTIETSFEIKDDNIFLQSFFLSEIGLIEHAAQTCSAITARSYFVDENNNEKTDVNVVGFISALKNIQITTLPRVASTITTKATLSASYVTDDYRYCTMNFQTFDQGKIISEGAINLLLREY